MFAEYHKGQLCTYKFLLCQEGFCSECAIASQSQPDRKLKDRELNSGRLIKANSTPQLVASQSR